MQEHEIDQRSRIDLLVGIRDTNMKHFRRLRVFFYKRLGEAFHLTHFSEIKTSITRRQEDCDVAPRWGKRKRQSEKVERYRPDKGLDTTFCCSVLVPGAGAGPRAGNDMKIVGVLCDIGVRPAKVIFNP